MGLYLRALAYYRRDWPLVAALLGVIGVSTAIGLLMAWPMAILVDSVLSAPAQSDWVHRFFLGMLPSGRVGQIIGLGVAGVLLKFAQDLLSVVQQVLSNQINYNGLVRVRCDLYRKLQSLSLGYHKSQPQGDSIYRVASDTFGFQTILQVLVQTLVAVVTLVVMTCVLMTRSVPLTLIAFAIAPPLAALNVIFGRILKARSLECKEQDAKFTTGIQRSIASIGLVQAFGREGHEFGRFKLDVKGTIASWWRLNRQQMLYNVLVGTVFGLGGAAVFVYGGYLVYRDQFATPRPGGLTVGDLMIFTSYLGLLWGPLCSLTGFMSNVQGGVAGAQRVFDVLDRESHIQDAPHAQPLPRQSRVLELDHVSFGYGDDASKRPVLRDVSVQIKPGQMVAFVGSSGVGKSTLLNLLPRFYDPVAGAMKLDGVDVRTCRVRDVRKHVALVLQESVILPTTIAENIAYGRPRAGFEQVRQAARLAGAAEFIERLPEGYDTVVNEGGSNLSGGQRQRIAIARALLTEAPFVVLDEPTSALDPHHEAMITRTLADLKRKRTIVLVSHRLSTVIDCDQIFMMEGGRIVEQGTHEELLAMRGLYWDMARQQLRLDDDDAADVAPIKVGAGDSGGTETSQFPQAA
jgi:ATP-binding cassette subfamily B protein